MLDNQAAVRIHRIMLRRRGGPRALDCWLALPAAPVEGAAPLVAVHGISRNAREIAETFAARAAAQGRAVIAPVFDEARWNGYQRAVAPRRADTALIALLEELSLAGVADTRRVDLFGYSGGAQFAHRFAMLYPHRINRLTAAAAGWWTYPDATPFPYGMGGERWGAMMAAGLPGFLALDIAVAVGARDDAPDAATRSTPALDDQQGPNRLCRARGWVSALRAAAAVRNLPEPRLTLRQLPGAGHDFAACARAGLTALTLRA